MRIYLFILLSIILSACGEQTQHQVIDPVTEESGKDVPVISPKKNTLNLGDVNSQFSIGHLSLEGVTPQDSGDVTEIESIPLLLTDIGFSSTDKKRKLSLQIHKKLHLGIHKNVCLALEYEDIEQIGVAVFCESDPDKTPGTALEIEIKSIEPLDKRKVIVSGSIYGTVQLTSGIKGDLDEKYRPITKTELVKASGTFSGVVLDFVGLSK